MKTSPINFFQSRVFFGSAKPENTPSSSPKTTLSAVSPSVAHKIAELKDTQDYLEVLKAKSEQEGQGYLADNMDSFQAKLQSTVLNPALESASKEERDAAFKKIRQEAGRNLAEQMAKNMTAAQIAEKIAEIPPESERSEEDKFKLGTLNAAKFIKSQIAGKTK